VAKRRGRCAVVVAAAAVLVVVSGCGELADRRSAASTAAAGFERALRAGDSVAACAALAPATRRELERSAKTGCAQAVIEQELARVANVGNVDVYGQQARVVFGADTVFLSRFSSGWKVTAAGCTARPERPYECEIKGG
jgi:hypothetical protein